MKTRYEAIHIPEPLMCEINARRGLVKKSTYIQDLLRKALDMNLDRQPPQPLARTLDID